MSFFFSSRRRHTRSLRDWSSDVCSSDLVEIVAELDGIGTVGSRFLISPFVGMLDRVPELQPDPHEVVRVFDVALIELLAPEVHHAERWKTRSEERRVGKECGPRWSPDD